MFKMMQDFFKGYFKYQKEIKEQDEWIKKYAKQKGYKINPHWMFYTNLKLWLIESQKTFGKRYCPCYEPSGDQNFDRKLLCPCKFAEEEIQKQGTCHCVLFGRGDLSEADFKKAEGHLMKEYRVPLKLTNDFLDTTGMPVDQLRDLPVPDSLHQVKRALGAIKGNKLRVLVENEGQLENLKKLADYKNLNWQLEDAANSFVITLIKK